MKRAKFKLEFICGSTDGVVSLVAGNKGSTVHLFLNNNSLGEMPISSLREQRGHLSMLVCGQTMRRVALDEILV